MSVATRQLDPAEFVRVLDQGTTWSQASVIHAAYSSALQARVFLLLNK